MLLEGQVPCWVWVYLMAARRAMSLCVCSTHCLLTGLFVCGCLHSCLPPCSVDPYTVARLLIKTTITN